LTLNVGLIAGQSWRGILLLAGYRVGAFTIAPIAMTKLTGLDGTGVLWFIFVCVLITHLLRVEFVFEIRFQL